MDEQWELIERLLPSHPVRSDGGGRPWQNSREVLNGIIWILQNGAIPDALLTLSLLPESAHSKA